MYPRCLECHTIFIQAIPGGSHGNRYIATTLIPGITCEKCHGPGMRHVELEKARSRDRSGSILNPRHFTRDQQLTCVLFAITGKAGSQSGCVSFVQASPSYFWRRTGRRLHRTGRARQPVGLLQRSKCYQLSAAMTCSTCHDEHAPERPAGEYSDRCLGCHRIKDCGLSKTLGHSIDRGCIGCHMPALMSKAVFAETAGKVVRARMRTHWIRVYR